MKKWFNQYIFLKKDIDMKDYRKINELKKICINNDGVNLKLELEYKLSLRKKQSSPISDINEFLYYVDNTLIGYLGIANFNGSEAEISGMVHPEWRRKGIFKRLYGLAIDECKRRKFERILLLCDDKSEAAMEFIKATGSIYKFSEYKMRLKENNTAYEASNLVIRKAKNSDGDDISRLDSIFFDLPNINLSNPEEEEKNNLVTFMIELDGNTIGKIRVHSEGEASYIYGFGILPEYRRRGYGREALSGILNLIAKNNISKVYLEVAADNLNALNLYKACGFENEAIMNYYEKK